ncbi:MAG: RNA polymerase sigma factor [Oscillospiraceae bacterium]|nr:RNA polymerase sigma factor [Oscillospiraceae bacterium]
MNTIEELYNTYFHDVYLYMMSLSKSEEISEEITQETFFRAMKSLDKFEGKSSIKTWLCQIARNLFINHIKKQKRFSDDELPVDIPDVKSDFVEKISDSSEAVSIYKILHNLEEPYKEVFSLRVFSELSFKQIADIFGKTESWARVTFHRGKLKISEKLEEKYE